MWFCEVLLTVTQPREMCNTIRILPLFCLISDYTLSIVIGASIGPVVIGVVIGVVIWWVLKRGNFRKENAKGDCSIPKITLLNFSRLEFYGSRKSFFLVKVK